MPEKRHTIPTEADSVPPGARTALNKVETFGLSGKWQPALAWASAHLVTDDLFLLIDAMLMREEHYWLGTALAEIASPRAAELLDNWRSYDDCAAAMSRLSNAALLHPEILKNYPPLSIGSSARKQLQGGPKGGLKSHYLFGLALEHVVADTHARRDWLVTLRIWVLVTALRLATSGNVQDKLVRVVAKGVRLACDRSAAWSNVVFQLMSPSIDLPELTAFLDFRADQIRHQDDADWGDEQKKFLGALVELAQGRSDPESVSAPLSLLAGSRHQSPGSAVEVDWTSQADEDYDQRSSDDARPAIRQAGPAGPVGTAQTNPNQSYVEQKNGAKSVYLLRAEDLHILPWSWETPNPYEATALDAWIDGLVASDNETFRLLGAMVWVAEHTGRSLNRTLAIAIADQLERDWTITTDFRDLRRLPPHRDSDWAPATADELSWVRSVTEANALTLPPAIRRVLGQAAARIPRAPTLLELWSGRESPTATFHDLLPSALARLTPGMLGNVLPQRLLPVTDDTTYARLVASSPSSGLPGAFAYGNWSHLEVNGHLNGQTVGNAYPENGWLIGAGSRLDPLEHLLIEAIRDGAKSLESLQKQGDFITFHNAYVAFLTTALFAATGVRPSRDPFEALRHFDFDDLFVYVDDKAGAAGRTGRLVPLPRILVRWVEHYRRYLAALAQRLAPRHPELAHAITDLASPRRDARLPFLFMLDTGADGLTWLSVSGQTIKATGLFKWPLPMNLFRQRLAKKLRRYGVDPEIIDGVLGHSEFGCATYADDSTRTWADDMASVRPHLEKAFAALKFPAKLAAPVPATLDTIRPTKDVLSRPFGIEARARERERGVASARLQAEDTISRFLADAKSELTALDPDQFWSLAKRLLLAPNNMPLSTGYERYQVLTDKLEAAWKAEGKRLQIRRRFIRLKPPPSLFSALAPGIRTWHTHALNLMAKLSALPESELGLKKQRVIATILLCLEARVCNAQILMDVLSGINYRIVTLSGHYDLEYTNRLDRANPDAIVERYPISPRIAEHLARLPQVELGTKEAKTAAKLWNQRIATCLDGLAKTMQLADGTAAARPSYRIFVSALAQRVDQLNAVTLPGALVAWFAGRARSAALGWRDQIRLVRRSPPFFETAEEMDPLAHKASTRAVIIEQAPSTLASEGLQSAARDFFIELRDLIGTESLRKDSALTPSRRRDLSTDIHKLLRSWNGRVAPSILLLGKWTSALVFREKGQRELLARSTIVRYLTALSPAFQGLAYASDLVAMDEDEVTALYAEILTTRSNEDTQYVAARLGEFHQWASIEGVEDPDWSEMPTTVTSGRRSPGIISEEEYQKALLLIFNDTGGSHEQRLACAFLLLCCYRFGLRGAEALGLRRDDWIDLPDGQVLVLVRNHPWRKLKTPAARRQVPLLFVLSELERTIASQTLIRVESIRGDDPGAPIFCVNSKGSELLPIALIKHYVIQILKAVTGNPSTNLHHARHTTANRIAVAMLGLDGTAWQASSQMGSVSADRPNLERVLLGTTGVSRRQSWGIARFLGHAGPRTLWQSYLHIHNAWARQCLGTTLASRPTIISGSLIDLDAVKFSGDLDTQVLQTLGQSANEMTFAQALRFLHLLARGKSAQAAAAGLALEENRAVALARTATTIGGHVRVSTLKDGSARDNSDGLAFLRRIPATGWLRLIEWTDRLGGNGYSSTAGPVGHIEALALASEMSGANGQIVMWKQAHFELARKFLDHVGIPDSQFAVQRTKGWPPQLERQANATGFCVLDPATQAGRVQVDAVQPPDDVSEVTRRAGIVFTEQTSGPVRHKIDLLVCLLGFCASTAAPTLPGRLR